MLKTARFEPPWVVIGHSYGGVLVKEYLMHRKEEVVGMLIVDPIFKRTKLPDSWPELLGASSYKGVVGFDKNKILSDEEWDAVKKCGEVNEEVVAEQEEIIPESMGSSDERIGVLGKVNSSSERQD